VLLECALSLVRDRTRVFLECHRVLKPLGRIIVTDIYARNPEAVPKLKNLAIHSCLRGAVDKDQFFQEYSEAGFGNVCFEDHSDLLRDFAVQMIWTYGSLDLFWKRAANCDADSAELHCSSVRRTRPGYFLFVGTKQVMS
jgi:arsenite methyltransferase